MLLSISLFLVAVVTLNSYLPLHVCDVTVPVKLLCHVRKVSSSITLSANVNTTSTSYSFIKIFPHFHQQLMIAPRKASLCDCNYKYKGVSLQRSFNMFITVLLHEILNLQSAK